MNDATTNEKQTETPRFTAVRCWAEGDRIFVRYDTGSAQFVVVQSRAKKR